MIKDLIVVQGLTQKRYFPVSTIPEIYRRDCRLSKAALRCGKQHWEKRRPDLNAAFMQAGESHVVH
jgi:hypothetical protein